MTTHEKTYMVVYIDVENEREGKVFKSHSLPDLEEATRVKELNKIFEKAPEEFTARAYASFYVAMSPG